jgi:hypothetical protein
MYKSGFSIVDLIGYYCIFIYLYISYKPYKMGQWTDTNGITWNYTLSGTSPNQVASIGTGVMDQGNATTTGTSLSGAITIPSTVGGYTVTAIGYYSFDNCTSLTSITIPDSVITLVMRAFGYCAGLTSITIPDSVITFGNSVFRGCSGLTSVTIGNSVTNLHYEAFVGCTGLTSITMPDSVILIGTFAFKNCTGLTSVTIGNSVTTIGNSAFLYCSGLTSITIPDSVTTIENQAFRFCTGLTSIIFPDSVTSIADYSFMDNNTSLVITMNTQTIGGTTYTSPTTSDISFFGATSVTLVLPPPSLILVTGKVPNWLQPKSGQYATMGGYESQFPAWCSPTSAANQLGHLVNWGGVTQPANINDGTDAGTANPVALATNTIAWDSGHGWGDYMLDGPTYRGKNLFPGIVTDFGWYMNTNNLGPLGAGAASPAGSTLQNIYNGMTDFYQQVGYTNMVGMVYHFNGSVQNFGPEPAYWATTSPPSTAGAGASADYAITLASIQHEIDNNRTVIACFNGWSIAPAGHADLNGMTSGEDETGTYQTLGEYVQVGPHGEQFNIASTEGEQANVESYNAGLGHTVLIVGYIPAGAVQDPTGTTEWLVVRDNFTTTYKNVLIPFANLSKLLATVYVNNAPTYNAVTVGGTDYGTTPPTTLTFDTNTLTIENSIDSNDTDIVDFVLPAGYEMNNLSVTNFVGTGTITYTLATGGTNLLSGNTFNATGTNLLAGSPLIATADTTYVLTLTADALITYTIVGTKKVNYLTTTTTTSALRQYPPDYTTSHVRTTITTQNGSNASNYSYSYGMQRKVVVSGQSYGNGDYYFTCVKHSSTASKLSETAFISNLSSDYWYIDSRTTGSSPGIKNVSIYPNPNSGEGSSPQGDDGISWAQIKMPTSILLQKVQLYYVDQPKMELYIFGTNSDTETDSSELNPVFRSYVGTVSSRPAETVANTSYTWEASGANSATEDYLATNTTQYKNYWVFSRSLNSSVAIHGIRDLYLFGVEQTSIIVPTSLSFATNTLTIENSIDTNDTDIVDFVLPAGYEMNNLSVTNFVGTGGTGTITYTLATGGTTVTTGAFTETGTSLLAGSILIATADTTYVLTLTADALITYTIVGTKKANYGVVSAATTQILNARTVYNTGTTNLSDGDDAILENSGVKIELFEGTGGTTYIPFRNTTSGFFGWGWGGGGAYAHGFVGSVGNFPCIGSNISGTAADEGYTDGSYGCHADWLAFHPANNTSDGSKLYIKITPSTGTKITSYTIYYQASASGSISIETGSSHINGNESNTTHSTRTGMSFTSGTVGEWSNVGTIDNYSNVKRYIKTVDISDSYYLYIWIDCTTNYSGDAGTLKMVFDHETLAIAIPSTLTFDTNTLTIENSIDTNDTDIVDFVLPAGYEMNNLSVTNFVGTGTITYTLATGGTTVTSGTFTATGTNLLAGSLLIATADTTYVLTLTADALITYTIEGTKKVDYGVVVNIPNWTAMTENYIIAASGNDGDNFGYSVASSGDYAIVGAIYEDTDSEYWSGAAYIFERNGSTWTQTQKLRVLKTNTNGGNHYFGCDVAISGNYAVIGAYGESSDGNDPTDISLGFSGAAYIYELENGIWEPKQMIKASIVGGYDLFGYRVSISGNYAIVGASFEDSDGNDPTNNNESYSGAAYVFERNGSGVWSQQQMLKSTTVVENAWFGRSVIIRGDYAIIGAPEEPNASGVTKCGAAYIFERNGSTWTQTANLRSNDADSYDMFGFSVSIHGDYAIIGSPYEASNSSTSNNNYSVGSGTAFIFERNSSGVWSQVQRLKAAPVVAASYFGYSVAIRGDYAIIGAKGSGAGATYIFERVSDTWTQKHMIIASNSGSSDYFGNSVSMGDKYTIVGAQGRGADVGAAYIFEPTFTTTVAPTTLTFDTNTLTIENSIDSNDTDIVDFVLPAGYEMNNLSVTNFVGTGGTGTITYTLATGGTTVTSGTFTATGTNLLAGSPLIATADTTYVLTLTADAAITYTIVGTKKADYGVVVNNVSWNTNQQKLTVSGSSSFGTTVAIDASYAVVGALGEDSLAGAAYIYKHDGGWNQTPIRIVATLPDSSDYFGTSVSVSNNYVIVGAYMEDSSSTINQLGYADSGAAYIFRTTDNGTTWSQTAILKALNVGYQDRFGYSVAISGDYAIISAYDEDSDPSGNNYVIAAGAAYIFKTTDNGANWTQITMLKTSVGGSSQFGYGRHSVAISGNYAIVGCQLEHIDGTDEGAVYIFEHDGNDNWGTFVGNNTDGHKVCNETQRLQALVPGTNYNFGCSVSINGNYCIVGAIGDDNYEGAAYIFERDNNGGWGNAVSNQTYRTETTRLKASDGGTGSFERFGYSVSINGGHAMVGADGIDIVKNNAGAVYKFQRTVDGSWNQDSIIIRANDAAVSDSFGTAMALADNYAIVGASGVNNNVGAAYIISPSAVTTVTPTTLTFDTNTLTIENSINTTDIDTIDFDIPAGEQMSTLNVTNFVGTGSITYTIATGGTTDISGAFTATGTNLLSGNTLVANANTTYVLTLDADAAITYTIVGTKMVIPIFVTFSNNILTIQDTDPDLISFVLPFSYEMVSLTVTSFGGSGTATYSLTGGSTNITGSFNSIGTNLLNVNILAESADTTYTLSITADPAITYTIVGTKSLDYIAIPPTSLTFSNNILTIENNIDANDTDAIEFVLPVGYEMNDLTVTSFNQTAGTGGIISYSLDVSGGSTVTTGTFTAVGTNILSGDLLVGSATPYVLTLDADATIVYTMVGTKTVDYLGPVVPNVTNSTTVTFNNNTLTIENSINNADTDVVDFVLPVGDEMHQLVVTNYAGTGAINYEITTGETSVKTGTILENSAIGTNLLDGTLLTSAIGSTYQLTLTVTAGANTYTIVGTKSADLGIIVTTYGDWGTEVTGETYRTETKVYDGGTNNYGYAVAMYGDYMMVGASDEVNTGSDKGSVYIYKRDSTNGWPATHTAKLEIAYVNGYEGFGCSIAMNENYMVVGAYYDGVGGTAYIFEQNGSGDWTQTLQLKPSTALASARFGESVAINGNYIVVGTLADTSSSPGGAAYIYELSGGTWGTEVSGQTYRTETKKIYPSVGSDYDRFGRSVAINGNYIIVTAMEEDSDGTTQSNDILVGAGAAYLFERDITTGWPTNETKYLKATTPQSTGYFGRMAAITENYIVITENGRTGGGAAYIYERDSTTGWPDTPTKQITAGDASVTGFGWSVAMNENRIVIGAKESKTAYIFDNDPSTGWPDTPTSKLLPLVDANEFGFSVAMHENYIGISARTGFKSYVFERPVVVTVTPTRLVFSNNILTIDNAISLNDTDVIDFVLPAGYNIPDLNVTNFVGTGNVSYTLTTGGNTVVSGSFSATSTNILTSGFPIFAISADTTYTLSMTADAAIAYTIVGTSAITNFSSFSITQLIGGGYTEQNMIDAGKWNADSNANRFDPTYIEGFLDVSGGNVTVSDNILLDTGDIELNSFTYTQPYTFNADLSLNNRLFVIGDVSMGDASLNIVGDMSINGTMSVGSYKPGSISAAAVAAGSGYSTANSTTTFTEDIAYNKKIEFNGDISLNPTTYFGTNTTLKSNNAIQFPDTTTIQSSNKESNGTTFKASTFNNMTVIGDFASNPQLTPSDYRIKTNVETLDETHTLDNLRPVKYKQTQTGKNDIGFLAHELQEHYPELVEGEKDCEKMQSVNYIGLLPILINEVQQLKKQIAETRDRIRSENN